MPAPPEKYSGIEIVAIL